MQHVTGLGGVFFKATDPQALQAWYRQHLGLPSEADDTVVFWWRHLHKSPHVGSTVWSVMPHDTTYMGDKPDQQVMVNFRVENLDAMLEQLRNAGVTVLDRVEEMEFGRFGWFVDPEGNRMELWQPVKNEAALMTSVAPTQEILPVDRNAQVTLRTITQETVRDILALEGDA